MSVVLKIPGEYSFEQCLKTTSVFNWEKAGFEREENKAKQLKLCA